MIIHNFRPGDVGGAELQAERLAKQLVRLGYPMGVLTWLTNPEAPLEEEMDGVQVYRVKHRLAYWVKQDVANTFRFLVQNRRTYDVLHAHMAYGHAVVAVVVARCFRKKCIIKIACTGEHGDLYNFSKFQGFDQAIQILYQADAIVAISDEVERELLSYGFPGERIVRIPNGVDADYFRRLKPFPNIRKTRFVLIGRRHPQKGIDIALKAVKIIKERGLGDCLELALYGVDYPEHDYRAMAQYLNVQDLVHFCPFEKDILSVYQASHCFVLPSRGEGLSNSLLESMAMELPVIATRVSGTPDVVEDGSEGLLIPSDSAEALADKMQLIIKDSDLALRLGKNARQKVLTKFSLDSVAKQYAELYQRL
jgi:glycosyltransferase involved in cell wall biosynthesis